MHWSMRERGAEAANRVRATAGMMEIALREITSKLIQLYSGVQGIHRTGEPETNPNLH